MAIPYQTTKFKSTNNLEIAILGSTAKFNSHQYFQLYGILSLQLNFMVYGSSWSMMLESNKRYIKISNNYATFIMHADDLDITVIGLCRDNAAILRQGGKPYHYLVE